MPFSLIKLARLLCLGFVALAACPSLVLANTGLAADRVMDEAGLISKSLEAEITKAFETVAQVHEIELALVTMNEDQLGLVDPKTYLTALVQNWRLAGRTAFDNHLIFLVQPNAEPWVVDAQGSRAETLIKGVLPDIWSQVVLPRVDRGQQPEGLRRGFNALFRELSALEWRATEQEPSWIEVWSQPKVWLSASVSVVGSLGLVFILAAIWLRYLLPNWAFWRFSFELIKQRFINQRNAIKTEPVFSFDQALAWRKPSSWALALSRLLEPVHKSETKIYRDRNNAMRLQVQEFDSLALIAPLADALASIGLLPITLLLWQAGILSWLFGLAWIFLILILVVSLVAWILGCRLALVILLRSGPVSVARRLWQLQALPYCIWLSRETKGSRQCWGMLLVCKDLGLGHFALIHQADDFGSPDILGRILKDFEVDLEASSRNSALRSLVYGLEKCMNWSQLGAQSESAADEENRSDQSVIAESLMVAHRSQAKTRISAP